MVAKPKRNQKTGDISPTISRQPALLTSVGRVLVVTLVHPDWTNKNIAEYLKVDPSYTSRALLSLVESKILVRTRMGRYNWFRLDHKYAREHPDITEFLLALDEFR